jgi:hypothetical protein
VQCAGTSVWGYVIVFAVAVPLISIRIMRVGCCPSFTAKWTIPSAGTRECHMVPALKTKRVAPFSAGSVLKPPAMAVYSSSSPARGVAVSSQPFGKMAT